MWKGGSNKVRRKKRLEIKKKWHFVFCTKYRHIAKINLKEKIRKKVTTFSLIKNIILPHKQQQQQKKI